MFDRGVVDVVVRLSTITLQGLTEDGSCCCCYIVYHYCLMFDIGVVQISVGILSIVTV